MNIETTKAVMIFRRDTEFGTFYSAGLSKKTHDGSYLNGYMPVQFKKGVEVDHKTKILIKNAWLSFYLKDNETKPYIFVSEFEILDETIESSKDPFKEMGKVVEDDDLPF